MDDAPGTLALAVCGTVGVVSLLNPLYFDAISIYPNGGAGFDPLLSAGLSAAGAILVAAAVVGGPVWKWSDEHAVPAAMLLAFALFVVTDRSLAAVYGAPTVRYDEYAVRVTIFAGLVVAVFGGAATLRVRDRQAIAATLTVSVLAAGAFLVDWRFDPLLGPVLDWYHFLTGIGILQTPYVGTATLVVVVAFGLWFGGWARTSTRD